LAGSKSRRPDRDLNAPASGTTLLGLVQHLTGAGYRAAMADSDTHIRAAGDLDVRTAQPVNEEPRTLRWVLAHMTGETARHAGHADILRELIDGVTGR
jgi:hypothetical protein